MTSHNTTSTSLSSSLSDKSSLLGAVAPQNQHIFDPWNTASTGHQRAENPYSRTTEWRQTRAEKLSRQFRGLPIDSISVGAVDFSSSDTSRSQEERSTGGGGGGSSGSSGGKGEWRWVSAEEAKRQQLGCNDIRTYMGGLKKKKDWCTGYSSLAEKPSTSSILRTTADEDDSKSVSPRQKLTFCNNNNNNITIATNAAQPNPSSRSNSHSNPTAQPKIFSGLTFYINGSTSPLISDHKLKQILAEHGATISIALGRRTVTHVILGRPNEGRAVPGAGGGLAAGKFQKEVSKIGGKGVKFVGVEWVLESIKASKRLSEASFAAMHMASRKQPSVYGMFSSSSSSSLSSLKK